MKLKTATYLFWGIATLGLVIRLIIISSPIDVLFARWGSDDLFYYSQIAGHVANGDGLTFDGINSTNGFQPLFLFTLLPFGKWMLNNIENSLTIVLIINSLFSILAGHQLFKLLKNLKTPLLLCLIASGLFLIHPKVISVTFNGTEAALSFLIIILSIRASIWVSKSQKPVTSSLIFGALVITRMDFSIILFLLFIVGMIKKAPLFIWVKTLVIPCFIFVLWLGLNYYYFDSIMPSSGQVKSLHASSIEFSFTHQFISCYTTALMSESKLSITLLLLALIGLFSLLKNSKPLYNKLIIFLSITSVVLSFIIIIKVGSYRDWYLTIHYLAVILLAASGTYYLTTVLKKWKFLILLIPILLFIEAQFSARKMNGYETLVALEQFSPEVSENETIGSFNAGIINTSLGAKHTVVNLDGVVNNSIIPFQIEKNLKGYLKENNITYIIDNKASIDFFFKQFGGANTYLVLNSIKTSNTEFVLIKV